MSTIKAALPARYKRAGRMALLRIARMMNAGSGVSCPCCGSRLRRFARFHGLSDQCPGCGSLMRHRALLLYLRDELRVESTDGDLLHVAPSAGLADWLASIEPARYVSVDLDPELASVQADVTELPFADGSFDLIVCVHLLEHVPDDRRAISELFRVLRPEGRAVIQVPPSSLQETFEDFTVTAPDERERLFGQYDHVRLCGADYRLRLEAAGFEVTQEDPVERIDEDARAVFGLRTGEPLYLCAKPANLALPARGVGGEGSAALGER